MSVNKKSILVSNKHQDLELELIINKSLYNKGFIAKDMFLKTQDILLNLIAIEKNLIKYKCLENKYEFI